MRLVRLMALSQTGDATAYRLLLTDYALYAGRSLSLRPYRSDIEDAVQDALLTLHSIRHTTMPAGRCALARGGGAAPDAGLRRKPDAAVRPGETE